jgi:hypothetical protein
MTENRTRGMTLASVAGQMKLASQRPPPRTLDLIFMTFSGWSELIEMTENKTRGMTLASAGSQMKLGLSQRPPPRTLDLIFITFSGVE